MERVSRQKRLKTGFRWNKILAKTKKTSRGIFLKPYFYFFFYPCTACSKDSAWVTPAPLHRLLDAAIVVQCIDRPLWRRIFQTPGRISKNRNGNIKTKEKNCTIGVDTGGSGNPHFWMWGGPSPTFHVIIIFICNEHWKTKEDKSYDFNIKMKRIHSGKDNKHIFSQWKFYFIPAKILLFT